MWVVSEIAAMATDLAEFLGGAIGLALLFDMPLIYGMGVTAVVTYGILLFERRGFRPMELIIGAPRRRHRPVLSRRDCSSPRSPGARRPGMSCCRNMPDGGALMISVGIIGATVMPHAVYLHSGLTQHRAPPRNDAERRKLVRYSNREVVDRARRRRAWSTWPW